MKTSMRRNTHDQPTPRSIDRDIPGDDNEDWDDLFNWLLEIGLSPDDIRKIVKEWLKKPFVF